MQMAKASLGSASLIAVLLGCAEPTPKMSLEDAQTECRAYVLKPVKSSGTIGISLGSGGRVTPSASLSVGVDLAAATNPNKAYEKCVLRNSGLRPVEPLTSQE